MKLSHFLAGAIQAEREIAIARHRAATAPNPTQNVELHAAFHRRSRLRRFLAFH
ncbi:MAG TPA: hypothetical protein VK871_10395 [Candidatus Limnocylindrales bacterium]|nr:hypothetical protein [Candidatus Limnocylindrales bacterium]